MIWIYLITCLFLMVDKSIAALIFNCPVECPLLTAEWDNICGSDGKIYHTVCAMRQASCAANMMIEQVESLSMCNEYCDSRDCSNDPKYKVCGNDGKVYESYCEFRNIACRSSLHLQVVDCSSNAFAGIGGSMRLRRALGLRK